VVRLRRLPLGVLVPAALVVSAGIRRWETADGTFF